MSTAKLSGRWQSRTDVLLGLLRLMTGFLFIQYGTAKLFAFPGPMMPDGSTADPMSLMGLAGLLEFVGGGLFLLGVLTRPIAFVLSGEMAFAYFMGHASQGFWPVLNQGTAPVLLCFVFLYFSAAGPGAFALSNVMRAWNTRQAGFTSNHEAMHHSR